MQVAKVGKIQKSIHKTAEAVYMGNIFFTVVLINRLVNR
jgi:hypothetical protein